MYLLSGNRNLDGRVHNLVRANYLLSPVAYALAGNVNIDFKKEPIGKGKNGEDLYLRDIWTRREKIHIVVSQIIEPEIIKDVYDKITK